MSDSSATKVGPKWHLRSGGVANPLILGSRVAEMHDFGPHGRTCNTKLEVE